MQHDASLGSSKKKHATPTAEKSPAKPAKTTDSETGQTAPSPALSAADSLAQALGFETIPSHDTPSCTTIDTTKEPDTTEGKTTTTARAVSSTTTDPLAEAFGFDTTPEDIEALIQLMSPSDSDLRQPGGVASSGYTSSNPMHTETYEDWANFDNS